MSQLRRNFVFLLGAMSAHSQSSVSEEQQIKKTKEQVSGMFYFVHTPKAEIGMF